MSGYEWARPVVIVMIFRQKGVLLLDWAVWLLLMTRRKRSATPGRLRLVEVLDIMMGRPGLNQLDDLKHPVDN